VKTNSIFLSVLCSVLICFAATSQIESQSTLDSNFENLIDGSNNFKEYKVIKKTELSKLRKEANTYASSLNEKIAELNDTIAQQSSTINALRSQVKKTDEELLNVNAEKNAMTFMGIQTSKSAYHTFVWGVIAILALLLIVFILKFKTSNSSTRSSIKQLQTTEAELEDLRRRSIEKEQKLGRQLQDERNKNARLKSE